MSKYYNCYFANFEELIAELKKVNKASDAKAIAESCEARNCPSVWTRSALKKYYELAGI